MANDSQNHFDSPKTIVAAPKAATAQSMVRPAWRIGGRCASSTAMEMAPTASAAKSMPTQKSTLDWPTFKISRAKAGKEVGDAAEEHGEQIERDGGENELLTPHESHACHEAFPGNRLDGPLARRPPAAAGRSAAAMASKRQAKATIKAAGVPKIPAIRPPNSGPVTRRSEIPSCSRPRRC